MYVLHVCEVDALADVKLSHGHETQITYQEGTAFEGRSKTSLLLRALRSTSPSIFRSVLHLHTMLA